MIDKLKTIVARLNQIRLDENLSYAELGERVGLDGGGLQKILKGQGTPYDRTLHKLERFLEEHDGATAATAPTRKRASA